MNLKYIFFSCLISLSGICEVNCYKILIPFPTAIKSLHGLLYSIGLSIANAGHNVTVFTSFDPLQKHPNIEHYQPKDFTHSLNIDNLFDAQSPSELFKILKNMMESIPNELWSSPETWTLYERRNEFDAIIMMSYYSEYLFPFLNEFKGHLILVSTPGIEYRTLTYSGNWLSPAVVPHIQFNSDEFMTFFERVSNTISFALDFLVTKFYVEPTLIKTMKKHFPNFGDIGEYYGRTALTLINGHFSLDSPVPLLPNQIEIGTINARKPKPLPKDLQKVFDEASPEGIIYFSLGSFVPSKSIPRKYKDIFIEAFRRLPHTVIWRYDEDDLEFPSNVVRRSWLPQEDILGHPKTKVFISHCGNLGTQEAKFHGVPVLGVPIAFDQPRNAARMERKGYAVVVSWEDLSVEKLLESIDILTKDNIYYDRLKNVSKIVQDQKDSPAERAAWWVEYVIRHDGAPHLRYAGQRLSFLQYIMVDVLAFWLAIFVVALLITRRVVKSLWRKCFGAKKTKKD